MKNATQNITVLHDAREWSTELEGEIGEIRVDGQKLNDIHDLALKIDDMTRIIKGLAVIATILAIIAVGIVAYIGTWLSDNKEQIASTMSTTEDRFSKRINHLQNSNNTYAKKLTELGWTWRDGKWQQIGNSPVNPTK
jgi:predicted PurR-regulated permease PerM